MKGNAQLRRQIAAAEENVFVSEVYFLVLLERHFLNMLYLYSEWSNMHWRSHKLRFIGTIKDKA